MGPHRYMGGGRGTVLSGRTGGGGKVQIDTAVGLVYTGVCGLGESIKDSQPQTATLKHVTNMI